MSSLLYAGRGAWSEGECKQRGAYEDVQSRLSIATAAGKIALAGVVAFAMQPGYRKVVYTWQG